MKTTLLFVALLSFAFIAGARAEEGFWPYDKIPRAEIEKKYGVELGGKWLKKVSGASLRFNNGGSGSFVSSNGLVILREDDGRGIESRGSRTQSARLHRRRDRAR